jgi:sterol 3beta-glucosyltransferase
MNILILALGSRGDVLPFATLGGALQHAGHRVRLVTFDFFGDLAALNGIELIPIPGDAQGFIRQAADGLLTAAKPSLGNPLTYTRTFLALKRSYGQLAASLPDLLSPGRFPDIDLVLNQLPAHLFGDDIAEALSQRRGKRIPWAILSVIPMARSHYAPLMGFQKMPFTGPLARLYHWNTYRLGEQIGWQLFRRAVNRWRKAQGLSPQPFLGRFEAYQRGDDADRPAVIQGFSPWVVPRLPDWGANIYTTGWWWPADTRWADPSSTQADQPPPGFSNPNLEQFLHAGEPPVFIGLGSMPVPDPIAASRLFCQAAQLAGVRLVLHTGWADLPGLPEGENVIQIGYTPYAWLFPQVRLVVHHGGSGTTGYALASGVPSLVLPFVFDQFYWGQRTAELGAGPSPIPFARLTAEKLAAAISQVLKDPGMAAQAKTLSEKLRAENGLRKAVEIVESIIN